MKRDIFHLLYRIARCTIKKSEKEKRDAVLIQEFIQKKMLYSFKMSWNIAQVKIFD